MALAAEVVEPRLPSFLGLPERPSLSYRTASVGRPGARVPGSSHTEAVWRYDEVGVGLSWAIPKALSILFGDGPEGPPSEKGL